ncbi:hypothetical protein OBBRIDRAFT_516956 [Obba rivulosa]|uniref:Uncharacterized protein n=1 Tax=Obba rivulosa TaxID=1052685 RepID=A0A8E2B4N3_9APHY|nr:hypothetical protein OBBRIDRAFT_516956 [Obba rivulosa]
MFPILLGVLPHPRHLCHLVQTCRLPRWERLGPCCMHSLRNTLTRHITRRLYRRLHKCTERRIPRCSIQANHWAFNISRIVSACSFACAAHDTEARRISMGPLCTRRTRCGGPVWAVGYYIRNFLLSHWAVRPSVRPWRLGTQAALTLSQTNTRLDVNRSCARCGVRL